jgi:uncharacterized protein YutE (UPF0331/DUF86 family)
MNDLLLAKAASIQRSVVRAREEFAAAGEHFATDFTRQDAAILNILRACETAIDLANVLIRERRLGLPQSSRESFELLVRANIIEQDLGDRLRRMVGFRNVAVHEYRALDPAIVAAILEHDLDDLLAYSVLVIRLAHPPATGS